MVKKINEPLDRRGVLKAVSAVPMLFAGSSISNLGVTASARDSIEGRIFSDSGQWSEEDYAKWLGAASAFKEGDALAGLAARDEAHRAIARKALAATTLRAIEARALVKDQTYRFAAEAIDLEIQAQLAPWTVGQLAEFLCTAPAETISGLMPGLSSDVVAAVIKLLDNNALTKVSRKIFNPLPGSDIGSHGVLGARIQPNSPTDNAADVLWQILNAWAFGVGDLLIGTNPVSSQIGNVRALHDVLRDVIETFGLASALPHCVLSHIDIQAAIETTQPGSTALWFQSLAGTDAANETFGISTELLARYASARTGQFALYFETGQGADFTNGHAQSMDMVIHESRKYGVARRLSQIVERQIGRKAWVHVNDVSGFIGPEVFRTPEQLVRTCLEDLVMGKLHGLCMGLDVCATLHMDVSASDLDNCLDIVAAAEPAYLMALPTKIDPMLGYLSTGYQDHLRLRKKFGFRVGAGMRRFFRDWKILDSEDRPGVNFARPDLLYVAYRRLKGDERSDRQLLLEAKADALRVEERGVILTSGFGSTPEVLRPDIETRVAAIIDHGRKQIRAEFAQGFLEAIPDLVIVESKADSRSDFLLHPEKAETLSPASEQSLKSLATIQSDEFDVQLVISDGLNAPAVMNRDLLDPFILSLTQALSELGLKINRRLIGVRRGRVRTGYRIGELLFSGARGVRCLINIIGERPGTGHDCFSAYVCNVDSRLWSQTGKIDHKHAFVVSGISLTALGPAAAAMSVVAQIKESRAWSARPAAGGQDR